MTSAALSPTKKLDLDIRSGLEAVGYVPEEESAATCIIVDHHVDRIVINDGEVVILPLAQALREIEGVQDLMFSLIAPDYDEVLRQAMETQEPPLGQFVHVRAGAKVSLPVQLFTSMTQPQGRQYIHDITVIDEGAEVDVVSGTVVPPMLHRGHHVSVSETFIGEGAEYSSVSVERWGSAMDIHSYGRTKLEAGAKHTDVSIAVSAVRNHVSDSEIVLAEDAVSSEQSVIFAPRGTSRKMDARINLAGENCQAESVARMVSDGGVIVNDTLLIGAVNGVKGFLCCDGLKLQSEGELRSVPALLAQAENTQLSHEASVGMVSEEKLAYLQAVGLTEDAARDLIVQGFVNLHDQRIPEAVKTTVAHMVSQARSGEM